MNRREVLTGLALASAAVAIPAAALAKPSAGSSRHQWDKALAAFRQVEARHDELFDRHDRAEEALHHEMGPRIDHYFDDYKLGFGMKRDDVEFWLGRYNRTQPKRIDVKAVADEFEAHSRRHNDLRAKYKTDELWTEARAFAEHFEAARNALMAIPAPDHSALLDKLAIAAISLNEKHAESTIADARRLLSQGRA